MGGRTKNHLEKTISKIAFLIELMHKFLFITQPIDEANNVRR